jgi:hypothetical protein
VTPVQKLRLQGFNASLKQRGVTLALEGSELIFQALVQPFNADTGEFMVSNETRNASKVHVLRDAPGVQQIAIGNVLVASDTGTVHRVTAIEDHPSNIALVFHCETASS